MANFVGICFHLSTFSHLKSNRDKYLVIHPKTMDHVTPNIAKLLQSSCLSLGKTLVSISVGFSAAWIFSKFKCPSSNTWQIQWYQLRSMLLVLEWNVGSFAKWMVLWLSQCNTYLSCFIPISPRNRYIHNISLQASVAAMYFASVVERDTIFCSLDTQDTATPTNVCK